MKYLLIEIVLDKISKKKLSVLINVFLFLLLLNELAGSSEIKSETIRFSSETARITKRDGSLHMSGEVTISYGQYVIKSDILTARTNGLSSPEVKIIEASNNVYFSNKKDISAKGDKLLMDLDKKFISIEGNVEFSQGGSIIKAEKINVDLITETVDFEGIKDSFIKN